MHAVEIIGGGLAGLALGLGLRRFDVEVSVVEAGTYPRHRTCGEFINGLDDNVVARLGLSEVLRDLPRRDRVTWYQRGARPRRWRLPRPALTVSRAELDARLADAFVAAGGRLVVGSPGYRRDTPPGRVFATGRRPDANSHWLGLKLHALNLPIDGDLEFHVGQHAYVGLCALPHGRVNVCGLFRHEPMVRSRRTTGIASHLQAAGLDRLADRLEAATTLPESFCAVAGLHFGRQDVSGHAPATGDAPVIGDAFAVVPPYTGHGMAMAMESAEIAVRPLVDWSRGDVSWAAAVARIRRGQESRFAGRLRRARLLHPFLLSTPGARLAAFMQAGGLVPLRGLAQLLKS